MSWLFAVVTPIGLLFGLAVFASHIGAVGDEVAGAVAFVAEFVVVRGLCGLFGS